MQHVLPKTSINNQLSVILTKVVKLADAVTSAKELRLTHLRACILSINGYGRKVLDQTVHPVKGPETVKQIFVIMHMQPLHPEMLMHTEAASPQTTAQKTQRNLVTNREFRRRDIMKLMPHVHRIPAIIH
jgi:hypothetical protein